MTKTCICKACGLCRPLPKDCKILQYKALLISIIGLANNAKTHKRVAQLNNIIQLCEMELARKLRGEEWN